MASTASTTRARSSDREARRVAFLEILDDAIRAILERLKHGTELRALVHLLVQAANEIDHLSLI